MWILEKTKTILKDVDTQGIDIVCGSKMKTPQGTCLFFLDIEMVDRAQQKELFGVSVPIIPVEDNILAKAYGKEVEVSQVARVALSLYVSSLTRGISNFSFDIIFVRGRSPDIDDDGNVDVYDVVKLATCYSAEEGDSNYNPNCDLNVDGKTFIYDVVLISMHYGEKNYSRHAYNAGLKL